MTQTAFLSLLNSIDFPQRYWDLCDRFRTKSTDQTNLGRKEDILAAFTELGIKPQYSPRFRTFEFEQEQIGEFTWSGVFVKQRHGVELMIGGRSKDAGIGSNFAVLAHDAKRLADPTFVRNPFHGPPPYPRPAPSNPIALRAIVTQHVLMVRDVKVALRRRASVQNS